MRLLILDPYKKIFGGNANEVILPGESGEAAVLDFHQPFFYCLTAGFITVKERGPGQRENSPFPVKARIPIKKGVALMQKNELVVLVETESREAEKKNA